MQKNKSTPFCPICSKKKKKPHFFFFFLPSCPASSFHTFCRTGGVRPPRGRTSSSKRSPMELQAYFHGFQGVVRPRRPHCGSATEYQYLFFILVTYHLVYKFNFSNITDFINNRNNIHISTFLYQMTPISSIITITFIIAAFLYQMTNFQNPPHPTPPPPPPSPGEKKYQMTNKKHNHDIGKAKIFK